MNGHDMSPLEAYIDGWRSQNVEAILATLDPQCIIIESHGPIYRGREWVRRWLAEWLADDGRVLEWTIHDLRSEGDLETAEWTFAYSRSGEKRRFDGSTIAHLGSGKITYLREYATTAPLYDWLGRWR